MATPDQVEQKPNIKGGPSQYQFGNGMQANMYPEVAKKGGLREMMNFELATRFPNPTKQKGLAPYASDSYNDIPGKGGIHFMNVLYNGVDNASGGNNVNDYMMAVRPSSSNTQYLWGAQRDTTSFSQIDSMASINATQAITWPHGSINWMYMVGAGNMKTDGSAAEPIGNIGPSVGFSLSSSGNGSINGTTKVRVSYVYGPHGESNAGDSVSITVSSSNIQIDSLPTSSSPLVNKRKIYRTDERTFNGRSGEDYWLAKTIDDNTTTTTTLTTKGDVLIASQAKPEDNSVPPDAQFVEKFANRAFYAGGQIEPGRLIYSKDLKPDAYEAPDNATDPNVIDSIQGDNDRISGMVSTRNNLYVFTPEKVWLLRGRNPKNWTFHPIHNVGTLSPDAITEVDGIIYFVGSELENVYQIDTRNAKRLTSDFENWMARLDWNKADRFWSMYNPARQEIEFHLRHRDYDLNPESDLTTGTAQDIGGDQKYTSTNQQRWLYADEPVDDSASEIEKIYNTGVNNSKGIPNVVLHYNTENGTLYLSDRGANAGAMRDQQKARQRPVTENPFPNNHDDSMGQVYDVYGSDVYKLRTDTSGTTSSATVFGRLDFMEREGEDPVAPKLPRRTYMTGFNRDTNNTASVTIGVSGDYGQSFLMDSGAMQFSNDLNEQRVWWGNADGVEGNRHQFRLLHDDSSALTVEGLSSEYRKRPRR